MLISDKGCYDILYNNDFLDKYGGLFNYDGPEGFSYEEEDDIEEEEENFGTEGKQKEFNEDDNQYEENYNSERKEFSYDNISSENEVNQNKQGNSSEESDYMGNNRNDISEDDEGEEGNGFFKRFTKSISNINLIPKIKLFLFIVILFFLLSIVACMILNKICRLDLPILIEGTEQAKYKFTIIEKMAEDH